MIEYQDELLSPSAIPDFFKMQGQEFGLSRAEIATILSDFYTLGSSNRSFPDPVPAQ